MPTACAGIPFGSIVVCISALTVSMKVQSQKYTSCGLKSEFIGSENNNQAIQRVGVEW